MLAPAEAAPLLFPEPSEITMTPVHEAILAALADGGAVFFRMLHERVAALLAGAEGTAKAPSDTDVAAAIWAQHWRQRGSPCVFCAKCASNAVSLLILRSADREFIVDIGEDRDGCVDPSRQAAAKLQHGGLA